MSDNSTIGIVITTLISIAIAIILIVSGIGVGLSLIAGFFLFIILGKIGSEIDHNIDRANFRKKKKIEEYKKESIDFYQHCKEKGIYFPAVEEQFYDEAKQNNITSKKCKEMFEIGFNELATKQKNEDQMILDSTKERLEIKGKRKFTQGLRDHFQKSADQYIELSNKSQKYLLMKTNTQATTHDWAIAGGVAQAIGGLGCGIGAAANVQLQNQAELERASQTRNKAYKELFTISECSVTINSAISNMNRALTDFEKKVDKIMNKSSIPQNYFHFSNKHFRESGTLSVTITASSKEADETTLDGIACVIVKDNDEIIGEGYITTPGYISNCSDEEAQSLSKIGFSNVKDQDIICFPLNNHSFSAQNSYTFEIKDIDVWRVNTKVLEESYKTLCDKYRDYAKKLDAAACDIFASTVTT